MKMFRQSLSSQQFIHFRIIHLCLSFVFIFFSGRSLAQDKRIDPKKLYEQGEAAHNSGNYNLALEYLNKCLKESPGFADAYFTRGSTREQLRDLTGANTDYNIYLELKPDQPEALLSRATVRYQLGLYEQAKTDFLKLLDLPMGETSTIFYNQSASSSGTNQ